jgi:hypothetical protein
MNNICILRPVAVWQQVVFVTDISPQNIAYCEKKLTLLLLRLPG